MEKKEKSIREIKAYTERTVSLNKLYRFYALFSVHFILSAAM